MLERNAEHTGLANQLQQVVFSRVYGGLDLLCVAVNVTYVQIIANAQAGVQQNRISLLEFLHNG